LDEDTEPAVGNPGAGPAILRHGEEAMQPEAGESSDDVFVILPEKSEDDDLDVTESIDDDFLSDTEVDLEPTESVTGELPPPMDDFDGDVTEMVDEDEFEQLASDIDDDEMLDDEVVSPDFDNYDEDDGEVYGDEEFDDQSVATSSGSGMKWTLVLAAVAVLGAGVYFYTLPSATEPGVANAAGSLPIDPSAPGAELVPDANVETLGEDPERALFRDRVRLALNVGFEIGATDDSQ
ncbi:MAG: hypothetical protein AAF517_24230, partial [Planctomycetota bacterium]